MKLFFYFMLFCILIMPKNLSAQKQIGFDYDYSRFNYDNQNSYFQIYYSITPKTFTVSKTDSGSYISSNLKLLLINEKKEKIINESYNLSSIIDFNAPNYVDQDLVGNLGFKIPFGKYKLTITIIDNYSSSRIKTLNDEINFEPYDKKDLNISDIQLCSNIIHEGANQNSIYYKNGLETVPNPKSIYGQNMPVLFYYSEIYKLKDGELSDLKLKRVVYKNASIMNSSEEKLLVNNSSIVKVGLLNVSKYTSGSYTLSLNLVDSKNNLLANSSKKFFVYNPDVKVENSEVHQSLAGNEFDLMDEAECDYNFDVAKYIAAKSEIELYKRLKELNAKQKFLHDFWKRRDNDPNTAVNEVKAKYMEKVEYVNSNYGNKFREGYKTDRGRVILIYGKPDRVDEFSSDSELKPYEIWYYDSIESGVLFVFGDTIGGFDYELLHSTKLGELRNENWGDRISIYGRNE